MTLTETAVDALRATFRGPARRSRRSRLRRRLAASGTRWSTSVPRSWRVAPGPADVVAAVNFGRDHDLPVAVRGGGHSAAGKGTCDDGIVIDLSLMKGVRVDPASKTVRAQGGVTWGDFDHETQAVGPRDARRCDLDHRHLGPHARRWVRLAHAPVRPVVRQPALGRPRHRRGRAARVQRATRTPTSSGRCAAAVATSVSPRASSTGSTRSARWCSAGSSAGRSRRRPRSSRSTASRPGAHRTSWGSPPRSSPRRRCPSCPSRCSSSRRVAIILCWSGDIDEGREVVKPWLDLAPPIQMVDAMPYTIMQSLQDDLAPPGRQSYWKSGYLTELTDDAIAAAAGVAAKVPSPFSLAEIVLWGGAVARVGADDTAFGQRDGRFLFNAISMWEDPSTTRGERRMAPRVLRRAAAVRDRGRVRELPLRGGRPARRRGLRSREVRAPRSHQGPVRPRQPLPAQPEHHPGHLTQRRSAIAASNCSHESLAGICAPRGYQSTPPWLTRSSPILPSRRRTPRTRHRRAARPSWSGSSSQRSATA